MSADPKSIAVFQTDPHVHALVHVIADAWTHTQVMTRPQIMEFLVEAVGQFEIARAAEIKRLNDEVVRLLGERAATNDQRGVL